MLAPEAILGAALAMGTRALGAVVDADREVEGAGGTYPLELVCIQRG